MTVSPDWILLVVAILATLALAAIAVTTRRRSSPRSNAAMWCRVLAALLLVGAALCPGSADTSVSYTHLTLPTILLV